MLVHIMWYHSAKLRNSHTSMCVYPWLPVRNKDKISNYSHHKMSRKKKKQKSMRSFFCVANTFADGIFRKWKSLSMWMWMWMWKRDFNQWHSIMVLASLFIMLYLFFHSPIVPFHNILLWTDLQVRKKKL